MRAGAVSGRRFLYGRKIHLAHLLQAIGMDAIEVGTPAMGGPEEEAIRALGNRDVGNGNGGAFMISDACGCRQPCHSR